MARLSQVAHDDRLSLVDHLDELRFRVVVSVSVFAVAFALCLWQNGLLLSVAHAPLGGKQPITLGVAEAFTTTLTVSAYAAIALALPVVLWQLYAFVLPAFAPAERRVAKPLMTMVPVLFAIGLVFSFYVVIPAALEFLLNFNASQFNLEIRAREYYGFLAQTLIAGGLLFQVPVGVLALTRIGLLTPRLMRQNRRYAIVGAAVVAMLMPGVDPVTMLIVMVPLLALYEVSIVLAVLFGGSREIAVPAPE